MNFDQYRTAQALREADPVIVARSVRHRLIRYFQGDGEAETLLTPDLAAWIARHTELLKAEARQARADKRAVSVHRRSLRAARKRAAVANDTEEPLAA